MISMQPGEVEKCAKAGIKNQVQDEEVFEVPQRNKKEILPWHFYPLRVISKSMTSVTHISTLQ